MSIAVTNYLRHSTDLRECFTVAQSLSCLRLQSFDSMALWQPQYLTVGTYDRRGLFDSWKPESKREKKSQDQGPNVHFNGTFPMT